MAKTQTILTYTIGIDTTMPEEEMQIATRLALASLLYTTARSLESGYDHGSLFGAKNKITLSFETDKWDGRFVIKIEKIDNE